MSEPRTKWRLRDLVDFEVLLRRGEDESGEEALRRYREGLEGAGAAGRGRDEAERRRRGLRRWLEVARADRDEESVGGRVAGAIGLATWLFGIVFFLAGIGVVRGLLHPVEILGKGYNVWVFVAVCLGLQGLVLLLGFGTYFLVRRRSGALSIFQRGALHLVRVVTGRREFSLWRDLLESSLGYRSALAWRLARLSQGAAICFNLGLLLGFLGCLWFLEVGFYWESTIGMSRSGLPELLQAMARPWEWTGLGPAPGAGEFKFDPESRFFYEDPEKAVMWPFLMMAIAVYGLLPRLVLWTVCLVSERQCLARLEFHAPRHRDLWRRLTRVERSLPGAGPADGAVLLDVGGSGVKTAAIREFLLRELRVNPQGRYTAAVLEGDGEAEALEAIRGADLGVVFLVEGWALSPKQMTAIYERVRAVGGAAMPVHFLVLGDLRDGTIQPAAEDDWLQWKSYVDSLQDGAVEVVAYRIPAPVNERG